MRSNGLPATSWAALGPVDPRLVPDLLDSLREAGIAGRAEPSTGTKGAYLEVRIPAVPLDQVQVDASHLYRAQELLHSIAMDAEFEALVADWEPSGLADPEPPPPPTLEVRGPCEPSAWPATTVWRGADVEPDPELVEALLEQGQHYVAPPPPPVPRPSWQAALALLLLAAGIVLVALRQETLWRFVGAVAVSSGVAGLVMRLRDASEPDDPFDDGARV
jgi:hypothetical protein